MTRTSSFVLLVGAVALLLVICGIMISTPLGGGQSAPDVTRPAQRPVPNAPAKPRVTPPVDARNPGWQVISNASAGLVYEVPPDWQVADEDESLVSSSGVRLAHLADWGTYTCQGAEYGRAFVGSGATGPNRPERVASELAASIAADQYSDGEQTASVALSPPKPVSTAGGRGVAVRAEATSSESSDQCVGDKGTVTVLAVPTPHGNAVFVVGGDTVPGRQQPTPLVGADQLALLVNTVRLVR